MANLIVSAVSTFDNKGLKKGKKEISTFEKQVKSFAKVFATAFSVRALTNYSKKAVQAFMADEKAAKSLEQQLKNTGYQFSSPSVELYIANLQKTTGVLDDELRPAFQQLLTVTGSITMSQDALNTAMNVSAATGRSLSQVTTALSRAYAGNTTGLSRLGAGLDKALLKSGDMDKIMAKLNEKFAGQSAARLGTYAGKMDLLAAAAANSQEIIGKGLLDALTALGDDNSIENITTGMENFATAISEVVVGLGQVGSKLKDLTNVPGVGNIFDVRNIPVIGAYIGGLRQIGRGAMPQQDRGGQERTASRINAQQRKLEAQAIKNTNALRKTEIDQLKKKSAVDQLKDKFDLERIGLTAALNAATDEETKLRLRSQLAILDNNEALAKKLLAEMDAAQGLKRFTDELIASTDKFSTMVNKLVSEFMTMGLGLQEASALAHMSARYEAAYQAFSGGSSRQVSGLPESYFQNLGTKLEGNANYAGMSASEITMERLRESGNRMPSVNVTVDASQSGDKFSQLIAEMIQVAGRSGYNTSAAGQLP
jgi:hypothetical protein